MAMLKCLLLIPLFTFAWVGTHARNITQRLNNIVLIQQEAPIEQVETTIDQPSAPATDTLKINSNTSDNHFVVNFVTTDSIKTGTITFTPKKKDSIKVVGVRSQPKKEVIKYVDTLKINAETQMEVAIRQQEIARLQKEIAKMQKEVAEKQREMEAIQHGNLTISGSSLVLPNQSTVTRIYTPTSSPLLILDGVPITNEQMKTIDQRTIESITVLKDAVSVKLYGENAKDGVVLITTKPQKETP